MQRADREGPVRDFDGLTARECHMLFDRAYPAGHIYEASVNQRVFHARAVLTNGQRGAEAEGENRTRALQSLLGVMHAAGLLPADDILDRPEDNTIHVINPEGAEEENDAVQLDGHPAHLLMLLRNQLPVQQERLIQQLTQLSQRRYRR